ncbi:MAG: hypothetical protein NZM94_18215, partial [Roseiflexus sp.]|nr:hypothetical protein [Roseiflexus sp.]
YSFLHSLTAFVAAFVYSFLHSLTAFVAAFVYSFLHSLTAFAYSFLYSLTHSFILPTPEDALLPQGRATPAQGCNKPLHTIDKTCAFMVDYS